MTNKELVDQEIKEISDQRLEHHLAKKSYESLRDYNNFLKGKEELISVIPFLVKRINELEYHCECDGCLLKSEPVIMPSDIKAASYEVKEQDVDRTIDSIYYQCICGKCTEFKELNSCIIAELKERYGVDEVDKMIKLYNAELDDARSNSI